MLINDIIELSELDSSESVVKMEEVDIYEIADNAVEMLRINAEKNDVTLRFEGTRCHINANKMMMEELVYNLLSNAIRYNKEVTFEHILELYLFNANFRQILFPQIEKIEINTRCRIGNYFANTYGVLGYKDANNFENTEYHNAFLEDIKEELRRNSKAPFVKNFTTNYEGGYKIL